MFEQEKYDLVVDSFLAVANQYIEVSLAVRQGRITPEEAVEKFDVYMVPVVVALMKLDESRGTRAKYFSPGDAEMTVNNIRAALIDQEVSKFRTELDGI